MAKAENEKTYSFLVEWFDNQSQTARTFNLAYFLLDGTIEMHDLKTRRTFLKRCAYPDLVVQDLFLGAQVTVYARQLRILDFNDDFTRRKLGTVTARVVAFIPPADLGTLGAVLAELQRARITVGRAKTIRMSPRQAMELMQIDSMTPTATVLSSGSVVALELVGPAAREVLERSSQGIIIGQGSAHEVKYIFENLDMQSTASTAPNDCTICIIKPHAYQGGVGGEIVASIQREFELAAMALVSMDRQMATELLDVYQGVLPECNQMIDEMAKGPCIVLQLTGKGVHQRLRAFCGPPDPEIARHLFPDCLRAVYGVDRVHNAVHCTDLEEDVSLESSFFFETIQQVESIKHGYF